MIYCVPCFEAAWSCHVTLKKCKDQFNGCKGKLYMVSSHFWNPSRLYPPLGLPPTPPPTLAQSISPQEMPIHDLSELSSCWQIHQYYIYNIKFCKQAHQPFPFTRKSSMSNNIVKKIKYISWFNHRIVIGSQRTTSTTINTSIRKSNKNFPWKQ